MRDISEDVILSNMVEENVPPGLTLVNTSKRKKRRTAKMEQEIYNFLMSCFNKKVEHEPIDKNHVGKMLTLISYDELFENSPNARIINQDIMISSNVAEEINKAIFSNSDGELGFTATCECGKLKGNYYEGIECNNCHTKVSTAFADKLSHTCWIAIPDDMPPVMHPIVYMVLNKWSTFKINETSLIDILLNPDAEMIPELKEVFPKQGFTYFYENHRYIFDILLNHYPKTANKSNTPLIRYFLNKYKHLLFCRKLPILHNSLHVITKSGVIRCVDNSVKDALKTALNITYASFTHKRSVTHDKFIDVALYNAYHGYVDYVSSIGQQKLGDKFSLFRHHLLGCRCHWSCRTVIVPHTTPEDADVLYMPWNIMVQSFKLELLNIMVNKYHLDPTEAVYRHVRALSNFDPLIYDILNDLINGHPFGGWPTLLGRNPSLQLGAIQLFKVTKVKTDIHDESINLSPLVCKAPNANVNWPYI